jgi:hypothetical protein
MIGIVLAVIAALAVVGMLGVAGWAIWNERAALGSREVHPLGVGLVLLAVAALVGLVWMFPESQPGAEYARTLERMAQRAEQRETNTRAELLKVPSTDTMSVRRVVALLDTVSRAATVARRSADSAELSLSLPQWQAKPLTIGGATVVSSLSIETRYLILVIFAGALGAFIHAAQSFSSYVGNEKFVTSWMWWYLLRPFTGAAIALAVFLVFRGPLLSDAGRLSDAYGIAAVAVLAGMFSKQATDKLNELFNVLFRPAPGEGDSARKDKLHDGAPTLTAVDPASPVSVGKTIPFCVKGTGFTKESVVLFDGTSVPTKFVDSTQLDATVPTIGMAPGARTARIAVRIPPAAGTPAGSLPTTLPPLEVPVTIDESAVVPEKKD